MTKPANAITDLDPADALPWLKAPQALLRRTHAAGRMPHALLIQAAPGLGGDQLARWAVGLVMCANASRAPCGACRDCIQRAANTHPDLIWVRREEEAKQLQVEQIRELCGALALKSYAGGYKAAIIVDADLMNANAANALLKTLEEPPPSTLLILCAARPSRLPATIVSRCQRVKVARPKRQEALRWLEARQENRDWGEVLEHAAGAPLRALELEEGGFAALDRDMTDALASLRDRRLDFVETAERWSKDDFAARLDWLETWITRSVRQQLIQPAGLPSAGRTPKIRALYGLLDQVRGLKFEQTTSLNMQLAAEDLLLKIDRAGPW